MKDLTYNIPEMRPTFEEIRRTAEDGKEYWSSRDLCNAMGYSAYWKFQRVIDKAIEVANNKGMNIDDHFNQAVDMVKIGSGSFRKVNILRLSRMACMIIAQNADEKKALVKQARDYFSQSVPMPELMQNSLSSNILLYKTAQEEARIEVIFNSETFWMSQKRMAELYGVETHTINYHLSQIFASGELKEEATIRKIRIVQKEGDRDVERTPLFYNLDAIIAVGYRVNSYQATQFRIWATQVLKEFVIKGYALDFAESRAKRHIITTMDDWKQRLQQFLSMNDYEAIDTAGHISQEEARKKAYGEYEKFRLVQDQSYISDFDRFNNGDNLLPFDINPTNDE